MKKTLILLLACCACIRSQAQTPEATAAPEPSATRTDSTLTFPEPEFIGQALAIRPDNRTEQLVQESLAPRHRSSTGQKLFGIGKDHIDEMTLKGTQVGTFGDQQRNTLERQPFTSRRFGSSSYLIILKDVQEGEYGITVDALGSLNVSTFGVDE